MPLIKAQCTNCKGTLEIDENKDTAICPYCGTAYIVEKTIPVSFSEDVNDEIGNAEEYSDSFPENKQEIQKKNKRKHFIMRCTGAILVIFALLFAFFFMYFNVVKLQGGSPAIFWSLVPISAISGPALAGGIILIELGLKG